jgi:hypothetical protein
MPLYSEDTATRSFIPLSEIPVTFSDVMSAQYRSTLTELPALAGARLLGLSQAMSQGARLSRKDAEARIGLAGLTGRLSIDDQGITDGALDILIERKREEIAWQQTFERAKGGFWQGASRLGVALATSLLDPINIGSAFVPVVGQARYAQLLRAAAGPLGRAGVRAGVGAIEGAAGAALVEPLIYTAKQQEQADYDMADALMNVAFGTIFGGGLHVVGGAGVDLVRASRGEVAAPFIPRADGLTTSERLIESRLARRITEDVDAAMTEYAGLDGAQGGRVLNTDLARELSPEYRADRTHSAAVHEPASYLVKQMYARKLGEAPVAGQDAKVIFSAGGTGAGKSTSMNAAMRADPSTSRAQILYDTNMNTLASAVSKIEQALTTGKQTRIVYTWRDPVDALVNGALPRAMRMGRTVPIEKHASTHVGAARTIKELARKYADDERVDIQVIDNSHGKNGAVLSNIDRVPDLEYNRVREDLSTALDAEYRAGHISEAVYRGTRGRSEAPAQGRRTGGRTPDRPGDGGRLEPRDGEALDALAPTAAERADLATPQIREAALRTAEGQMADGRPVDVEPYFAGSPDQIAEAAARRVGRADPEAVRQAEASRQVDEEIAAADEALETAVEEAGLAEQLAQEQAKRYGVEATDEATEAAREFTKSADRWSKIAEAATGCLLRGS